MKPEQWGSSLVQEKYREEKVCDKSHPYLIIIIIIIIIIINRDCRRRNKNLSIAWIDYQKAFDSVPHSWVEKSIALVGVNSKIVRFRKLSMEKWNTRLFLKTNSK